MAYALSYIVTSNSGRIDPASITILADSDYYSQPDPPERVSPQGDGRFMNFGVPIHMAHKTGLGSSAALVTAFIAAVMAHYLPPAKFSIETSSGKAQLHNLAQAAHCAAQGKVGSGFDVAAAVYGSCIYRRFSPAVLEGVGEVGSPGFARRLSAVVDDKDANGRWNVEINPAVKIPSHLRLVMCDVDCGSQTVGMVRSVLAWRRDHPEEATLLWGALQKAQEDLVRMLDRLNESASTSTANDQAVRDIFDVMRSLIREMSQKSGVPVEPEVQTKLLDACCKFPGVVGGVVPGAGGYDAIALLVHDSPANMEALAEGLDDYATPAEQGGSDPRIGKVKLLGVRQSTEGIRKEDSQGYGPWLGR